MYYLDFIGVELWTALFVLLNTLTVIFVGTKFLFKPVMKMIEARQTEIDNMYANADNAEKNAKALENEYNEKLAAAKDTSERIIKEAVARGQSREEEIIRQANRDAAAIMDKANADIALEKKKAVNEAKDEISVLAMEIAGKVVGRSLTDADHAQLVESFIDELGE
ncbi:MAG: F0F1 ATP synthase subunit B [Clostridia bacterium]|nr:F0F1 ATP synthase subunit B [Clostridia bacterium]MBQ6934640.1 F0F1 ATP synthase subunit B [Clostridia bacterium]MBQ7086083.1 F0F1 ATP synthase subunit B [Clostridia bacterium]MBQ7094638.1 F0F1 ATP synthase subunit B [Clostridia bacterium]